ncbi:response regulator transcription factor [Bordetella genomosp. 12]|uniref:DNA-binding response regulator n=1 Tax=Bordetella genomosp. 12 TaxID=463035 RepID=A0A261VSB6_9BORD|nr:response regulator transcription factor [Bordetella genomosp. 12]OZI76998.1 DNA-binding response regulator [Bordetella genomosp. 12]
MRIASLEDDLDQAQQIQQLLEQAGYECSSFQQSQDLLAALRTETFDLILVDWQVPDMDGDEVVRYLRSRYGMSLPIIFLTSRNQEEDLVQGLQAGADDYIVKPLRPAELLARIAALWRRMQPATRDNPPFDVGPYHIDPARHVIELRGESINLAPKEYELALLFLRNLGRLLSRDLLAETVWNREIPPTSRTLDTHLSNVRQKLQLRPQNGLRLSSSYALGYRLETVTEPTS